MKRFVLAMLLALSTPLAFAASPSDAQLDKLLEVMRARSTVDAMLPMVEASQQQMIDQLTANKDLNAQQRETLQRILARSRTSIRDALAWKNLEPIYIDIYRQTFSAEDVEAMVEFYGSATGQRLLDKMPQLVQHTMTAMQKLMVPMLQQLEKDVAAEVEAQRAQAGASN
jgi:hypothetical protein